MKWISLYNFILLIITILTINCLKMGAKCLHYKSNIFKKQNKDESIYTDKNSLTQKEINDSTKMNFSYDYLSNKKIVSDSNFEPNTPVLMQNDVRVEEK